MNKSIKILLWIVLISLLLYFVFTLIAPPIVDKDANKVSTNPPYTASKKATDLYNNLDFVGDLHCDALLWNRDLTEAATYGHVDFPRMQQSNVAFQAFTIVTKSPKGQNFNENSADAFDMITALSIGQGQRPSTWFSLFNRAIYQTNKLKKFASAYNDKFVVVQTKKDFERLLEKRKQDRSVIGGLLGVEGGHCLEGDIGNVERLYNAGVRMLGPTHFFDNEIGGSAHGTAKAGLTDFGMKMLKEMGQRNMIMDVAHSSDKVVEEVLQHYKGPILTSHTGVDGTKDSYRNLSDKHLKAIAQRGGIIGIAFFSGAIGDTGIPGIVKAMKYTKDLIGVQYIALGSDFDGSVTTPFDVTGYPLLVEEMLKQGFTPAEIKAIMGENLKRFLLENL